MHSFRLLFFTVVIAIGALPASASAPVRTVVLANWEPANVENGALAYQFSDSVTATQLSVDNEGRTAFRGRMISGFGGVTTDTDTGIWSGGGESLMLVAREGSQAPGVVTGGIFSELRRDPLLNDNGDVAFPAYLRQGTGDINSTNNSGIWAQRNGQLELVARAGSQAPGTPAATTFSAFTANGYGDGFLVFNNLGQTAFTASLAVGSGSVTTINDTGIWADTSEGLALIAREGATAPGAGANAVFEDLSGATESLTFNSQGRLAFTARLRLNVGGVNSDNNVGIWTAFNGATTLALREGSSAPTPAGATFRHFDNVRINDAGNLIFRGYLDPGAGGVTLDDDEAIWLRRDSVVELVAREGSQTPGAASGVKFGSFTSIAFNNHHRVVMSGYLQFGHGGVTGENSAAVWSGTAADVRLVARENELAPGALGAVFNDFFPPSINVAGQVAFMGTLKPNGGGVTTANDRGIWATDVQGALHLIAREGDLLEVAPGDQRTIAQLGFSSNSGNSDGRYSMFNDFGQVQFWAQFTGGGEGIFVSDLVKRDPAPADFDQNGIVDAADLAEWRVNFGKIGAAAPADGDADNDGDVDGRDLLTWQRQLGGAGGAAATVTLVPEPNYGVVALCVFVAARPLRRWRASTR